MLSKILGVSRMQGVGKTSKAPYDMARVLVINQIKPFSKEGLTISGHGYEVAEVALHPAAMEQFANLKYPCEVDLETDMETRGGKLTPIVTGLRAKAA